MAVAYFALMMEEVSAFEMSVNFYQTTRRNIPEDSHLHFPAITENFFLFGTENRIHLTVCGYGCKAILEDRKTTNPLELSGNYMYQLL
jgi:hypothetical protein